MNGNVILIPIKQVLLYIYSVVRNALYLPYITSLFIYLFLFFIVISGTILSNDAGIGFINKIIKTLFDINIINDSTQNIYLSQTVEETKKQIIFIIVGFGVLFDLVTRAIYLFKKDFDKNVFKAKLIKTVRIFYAVSFVIYALILLMLKYSGSMSLSDITILFSAFLIIFIINITSFAIAYSVTNLLGLIINNLENIKKL